MSTDRLSSTADFHWSNSMLKVHFLQRVAKSETNPRTDLCKWKPGCQTHWHGAPCSQWPGYGWKHAWGGCILMPCFTIHYINCSLVVSSSEKIKQIYTSRWIPLFQEVKRSDSRGKVSSDKWQCSNGLNIPTSFFYTSIFIHSVFTQMWVKKGQVHRDLVVKIIKH